MAKVTIKDYVSLCQGVTSEEGQPIYNLIIGILKSGDIVELDFDGMTFMTTAFLNVVIGTLYKDFSSEELRNILKLQNVNEETATRIKRVTDNAKAFYADKEGFTAAVEEAMNENK